MSRRCERRASHPDNTRIDNKLWYDLLLTYHRRNHAFLKGCGQSTMQHHVRDVTGRSHASHHLRQVLNAAVEQGLAARLPSSRCSAFRIDIFKPFEGDPHHAITKW